MQTEKAKAVGIWIRVSTEDQVKGESPEHHERRARAYAEAKGWHVAEVFRLEAVSGKAVMAHPEAKRMLAAIRDGSITGLVFSKLARLARNTKELLEFAEIFRACGADLVSLAESIDTSTPAGRLFFTMIAAMAQWEREEISERVAASVPIRAKMGKTTGGAAPFGYQWVDKRLQPHPEEAPVRILMHELFIEHRRIKRVARILNDRGYRTRKGTKFSDTSIARLLEDSTPKGVRRTNYTHTKDNKGAWELKPESEWVFQETPAIMPADTWDEAYRIYTTQRASLQKPTRSVTNLFAGYAVCECGTKMYVWANSPKYRCNACNNKIPVQDLEAVYREQLHGFLVSPEEIAAHNEAANEAIREKERLIEAGQAELRKLEAEDDRLYALYLEDALSKEDFGRRHKPLAERRTQLEEELPRLEAERDVLRIGALSREEALGEARSLAERWEDLAKEERRQIVEAITDRIIVGKEDVEIVLLNVPSINAAGKATNAHARAAARLRRFRTRVEGLMRPGKPAMAPPK